MGSDDKEPLHESLFAISYNLSKEFPAMCPPMIDEMTFVDVINLYSKVRKYQIREEELSDPNRVIRIPAGDKWF